MLYTIPNPELGYCVPSQGMYWYILGQNLGPQSKIRAIRALSPLVSNRGTEFGPKNAHFLKLGYRLVLIT